MRTVSEQLFEEYCTLRGYPFKPIEIVVGKGRFPDYEVQTPQGAVICEVKEITPNAKDRAYDESLVKYGQAASIRDIGKRPRVALKAASKQLGRFRNDPRPCIAVLFDTTYKDYLSSSDIDAAMFGDPLVLFSTDPADRRVDFTHGLNRKLTENKGLYIGAVAVLLRADHAGAVRVDIYHNPFTLPPKRILPAYFPDPQDRHFIKNGHPDECGHGWHEYADHKATPNTALL